MLQEKIMSNRQDKSKFLDKLIDAEYDKAATIVRSEKMKKSASTMKMSLFEARIARRSGKFIKIAGRNDLYQDAQTKDLWKVSDDKSNVIRTFDDVDGIIEN